MRPNALSQLHSQGVISYYPFVQRQSSIRFTHTEVQKITMWHDWRFQNS